MVTCSATSTERSPSPSSPTPFFCAQPPSKQPVDTMSASIEVGAHTTSDVPQDSEEFQTIVQSIGGAQDPEILFPSSTRSAELPTDEQGENTTTTVEDGESAKDEEEKGIDDEASYYWDASTMAPLSSASAVSTYTLFLAPCRLCAPVEDRLAPAPGVRFRTPAPARAACRPDVTVGSVPCMTCEAT